MVKKRFKKVVEWGLESPHKQLIVMEIVLLILATYFLFSKGLIYIMWTIPTIPFICAFFFGAITRKVYYEEV